MTDLVPIIRQSGRPQPSDRRADSVFISGSGLTFEFHYSTNARIRVMGIRRINSAENKFTFINPAGSLDHETVVLRRGGEVGFCYY
jgi:hypothetical protein